MIKQVLAALLAVQLALPASVFAQEKPADDLSKQEILLALHAIQDSVKLSNKVAWAFGVTTAASASYAGYLYYRVNKVNKKVNKFIAEQREVSASLNNLAATFKKTTAQISKRVTGNSKNVEAIAQGLENIGEALNNHAQVINANTEGLNTILEGAEAIADAKPRRRIGFTTYTEASKTAEEALTDIAKMPSSTNYKQAVKSARKMIKRSQGSRAAIAIGLIVGTTVLISAYIDGQADQKLISNNRAAMAKVLNNFADNKTDMFIISVAELAATNPANEKLVAGIISEDKKLNNLFREQVEDFNSPEAREAALTIAKAFASDDDDDTKTDELKSLLNPQDLANLKQSPMFQGIL